MTLPLEAAQGFALGAGLIVAIGAQNAFVLRQGLMRRHVAPLVLFCAAADAALILAGALGMGALVNRSPMLLFAITLGGAAYLVWQAWLALRRALRPHALHAAEGGGGGPRAVLATAAGVTFLNPHVYLDTVALVGGLAATREGAARAAFAGGAMAASFAWFAALGFGARLLAPVFARPAAWRALDLAIAAVMAALALALLREAT